MISFGRHVGRVVRCVSVPGLPVLHSLYVAIPVKGFCSLARPTCT